MNEGNGHCASICNASSKNARSITNRRLRHKDKHVYCASLIGMQLQYLKHTRRTSTFRAKAHRREVSSLQTTRRRAFARNVEVFSIFQAISYPEYARLQVRCWACPASAQHLTCKRAYTLGTRLFFR
jgi:hypothetical protein